MAGLLDFIKTPRSDNPNRKASLAGRSQVYNLLDNIIGFNDDRVTPGEALGAGLRTDPIGLLSAAAQGVEGDLSNLMFEGGAMQRPQDVLGYAAAPMAPGAMSGRMANVMSSGGAKPTLDQMRANARQRREARVQMLENLTQDDAPIRMKSANLSVLVSRSPDREGWRVTYFQPDGSPSGHFNAKDKTGAVQRALEDQFTPIAARPAPPPSPAQEVAGLLSSGRADEVTDEMLAKFTPKDEMEIFDLYQRGATGMDLPMDEASRMGRAGEIEADHGTTASFPAFDNRAYAASGFGTHMGAKEAADSILKAKRSPYSPADAPTYVEGSQVLPLRVNAGPMLRVEDTETWNPGATQYAMAWSDDPSSVAAYNAIEKNPDYPRFGNDAEQAAFMQNYLKKSGFGGFVYDNKFEGGGDSYAVLDPANIRSRFARFDPRLSHLRNLSAGVGGMGLLGMSYPQEEQY